MEATVCTKETCDYVVKKTCRSDRPGMKKKLREDLNSSEIIRRASRRQDEMKVARHRTDSSCLSPEFLRKRLQKQLLKYPQLTLPDECIKNILKKLPDPLCKKWVACCEQLLEELRNEYVQSSTEILLGMKVFQRSDSILPEQQIQKYRKPNIEPKLVQKRRIYLDGNILYYFSFIRHLITEAQKLLPLVFIDCSKYSGFKGFYHPEILLSMMEKEIEREDLRMEFDWFGKLFMHVSEKEFFLDWKENKVSRFINLIIQITKTIALDRIYDTLKTLLSFFTDPKTTPKIAVQVYHSYDGTIVIIPTAADVYQAYCNLIKRVYDMGKNFVHFEMFHLRKGRRGYITLEKYDNIRDQYEKKIKDFVVSIYQQVIDHYSELSKKYKELMDDSRTSYESLSAMNMEELIKIADYYITIKGNINEIELNTYFPHFKANNKALIKALLFITECRTNQIMNEVLKFHVEYCERNCEEFNNIARKAVKVPESTEELISLAKFMNFVSTVQMDTMRDNILRYLELFYRVMEIVTVPQTYLEMMGYVLGWVSYMESVIKQNSTMLQATKFQFEERLNTVTEKLNEDLENFSTDELDGLDHLDDYSMIKNYTLHIMKCLRKVQYFDETAKWINKEETLFEMTLSTYPELDEIKAFVNPFAKLIFQLYKWNMVYQTIMDGSLESLTVKSVEETLEEYNNLITQLQKWFKSKIRQQANENNPRRFKGSVDDSEYENWPAPLKLLHGAQQNLEEIKQHMAFISLLCNPRMTAKHWDKISAIAGRDMAPYKGSSLRRFINFKVHDKMEEFEVIGESAVKEYQLQESLMQMKIEWENINFALVLSDIAPEIILDSTDHIQSLIDDHLVKTLSIRSSSFVKPIEDDLKNWYNKLGLVNMIIEEWCKVQHQWLYFMPIFSSKAISNQMENEGQLFTEINNSYKGLLQQVQKNSLVMDIVCDVNVLPLLKSCLQKFEKINYGVKRYLEKKRLFFSRFFFLSDDDMLQLLSETKDPKKSQLFLKKCFTGISKLGFDDLLNIESIISSHLEEIKFLHKISTIEAEGSVEKWLAQVEDQMIISVRYIMKKSMHDYCNQTRNTWIQSWPGQTVLCISKFYWTQRIHKYFTHLRSDGLAEHHKHLLGQINLMFDCLQKELPAHKRITLVSLIVHDVHSRDVLSVLMKNNVTLSSDFLWISQLRYYWEHDLKVKILNASVKYAYEYLGNKPRLVVTPLTERCYRTLIGAYHLQYSAALEGPTSTGKTETIKDLAQAIAIYCHIFNCSQGMNFISMEKFLKGVASSGAWICFHEFDRIKTEVLSVIAQQMLSISQAIRQKFATFMFAGTTITVNPTCFVCITLNPGYIERYELPSNLKVLFRPVAMMVPDFVLIAEVFLFSNGFKNSRILATKIVTAFKLCAEMLPPQSHYDFGLRSLKSVLLSSKSMKVEFSDKLEEEVLLKAFISLNLPKIPENDISLFHGIVQDIFPGVMSENTQFKELVKAVNQICKERNLQPIEKFLTRVSQAYEIMLVHHSIMFIGAPFGGKTAVLQVLSEAKNYLKKHYAMGVYTTVDVINPNAVTLQQLYGYFHLISNEWIDGIIGKVFRPFTKQCTQESNWVIFDGPVSPYWIENMNTALDEKKIICLSTGEIIEITPFTSIVFECMDLLEASPATVSRCRMVHFESSFVGWKALVKSWNETIPSEWLEDKPERFIMLFDWLIPVCSEFIEKHCHKHIDVGIDHSVKSICDFIEMMLYEAIEGQDVKYINTWAQAAIIQAIVWCLAGKLSRKSREIFDTYFRTLWQYDEDSENEKETNPMGIDITLPNDGLIEDNLYIYKGKGSWKYWPEVIKMMKFDDIFNLSTNMVSTVDSLKYSAIVEMYIKNKKPFLLVGPSGTGKTTFLRNLLMNSFSNENFLPAVLTFTASTKVSLTQEIILSKLIKKKKGIYGPSGKRTCIMFIDDINMLQMEGSVHPSLELLRQFFDHNYWYGLKDTEKIYLHDLFFVAAMGMQCGNMQHLPLRFLRHFTLFSINSFTDDSLTKIFTTIVFLGLRRNGFPTDVMALTQQVISASIYIYNSINANLLPTPVKCHYLFSIRDISRVFQGFLLMRKESADGKKAFIRLWVHEVLRVFSDRLIDISDKNWLFSELKIIVEDVYKEDFEIMLDGLEEHEGTKVYANQQPLSNLIFTTAFDSDATEYQKYEEIPSIEAFYNVTFKMLEEFKSRNKIISNIILFRYALEHIAHILRILSVPNGNGVLIGVNGTGRQSLVKLASYMAHQELFQPEVTKKYAHSDWKDDLKNVLKESGAQNKACVLLLNESQLKIDYIIQDIDSVLSTGEVPNLYATNEIQDIVEIVRLAAQGGNINTDVNPLAVFEFFINRCKKNLHLMLCFSPIGSDFRTTSRTYPSIVNCCTIDWFEAEWTLSVNGRKLQTTGWPEDALECIAKEYLTNVELEDQIKQQVIDICKYFHASARNASNEFYSTTKRKTYITSASYIDLLKHYSLWVKKKRDELEHSKDRYLGGLEKLEFAACQVEIMQRDLESLQPALKKAAEETTEMLKVIETETFEVEKASERVRLDEEVANEQAMGAMELKTECENDLALAIPILEDAVAALNTLKPADITLVKSMKNPPETVKLVLAAVCVMKGIKPDRLPDTKNPGRRINDYWGPSKRLLGDMSFLQQLKDYDKDNIPASIMKAVRSQYLNHKDFKPKVVAKASSAAEGLCKWVIALDKYDVVVKEVAPKKEKLRIAEKEYSETMAILEEKRNLLRGLEDKLAELKDNLREANERKIRLQNEVVLCSNKLQKAQRIIGSLGGEKERWVCVAEELKKQFYEIPGNILVSCSIIAYLSPFTPDFRQKIVADWCEFCLEMEIPLSAKYSLANALGSRVLVEQWRIFGLPNDNFSIENAVILDSSEKWSLLIDPQNEANKWIKNMERANDLCVVRHSGNFAEVLKYCVTTGKPLLLENIQEDMDPFFDPIIRKETYKKDEKVYINIEDTVVQYHHSFRFYMTTKLSNPHFLPEIYKHITIINFVLTEDGLADHLLEIVVAKERPELQEKRQSLIRESTKNKQDLQEEEDKILKTLSSVVGNILEDENAVNSLDSSKAIAEVIKQKDAAAKETRDEIENFRKDYKSVGDHCAALYYTIVNLSNLDPMYQYSLDWFVRIFIQSIDAALKTNVIEERIGSLKETFNYGLYVHICYTLFEKDRILYSFILCKILLQREKKLVNSEVDLLLGKPNFSLCEELMNPASEWLPEKIWKQICWISSNPTFGSFVDTFCENIESWKTFYFKPSPTCDEMPLSCINKLTSFQKLILLYRIRPDRLISGIRLFIREELGDKYLESPSFDLNKAFEESDSRTPLILIQSPGNDSMQTLLSYVKKKNKMQKFKCISLGENQDPVVHKLIEESQVQGDWICLQNCHLSLSCMQILEKIMETFDFGDTALDFRLWLTSDSSKNFPVSILQCGVKMTNERPTALKENLYQRFTLEPVSDLRFFESCPGKEQIFTTLLYCISFFHSVICERGKFGTVGWNKPYSFDESDYLISILQVQMFISDYEDTPVETLLYLLAECNYGGKITDPWDKRTLNTILKEFVNEDIICLQKYTLIGNNECYSLPVRNDYKDFIHCIENLPSFTIPDVHGLHVNAGVVHNLEQTMYFVDSHEIIFGNCIQEVDRLQDEDLQITAETILSKVPVQFDIDRAKTKYPYCYNECMNTVLIQEMCRINEIINVINETLTNLIKAVKGFRILSPDLETISISLYSGKVPSDWLKVSYPSIKSLGGYVTDLLKRVDFIQEWYSNGFLKDYWLSGFSHAQAFLTAVIQHYSRKFNIPYDNLAFDFQITDFDRADECPDYGIYVYGIFLTGARWDRTEKCLTEEFPLALSDLLPVLWIKPSLKDELNECGRYVCPVYITQSRDGPISTTGHSTNYLFSVLLTTKQPTDHWIKRGTAIVCQLND